MFSMMVDDALEKMKGMLESNKAMQEIVNGKPEDDFGNRETEGMK